MSNNVATGGGGGFHSVATVQLRRSNVSDNAALKQGGGGILAPGRTISVIDSTLSGNRTVGPNSPGGGIVGGTVTISQSTISNNRTENLISPGGGIFANQLTLHQSTVAANRALGENSLGGGIHLSGALTLNGSIIADNTAGGGNPDIRTGSVAATNYALIGSTAGLTTVQLNVITLGSGNQLNVDPQLGPLAYNGGPTFADGTRMKTHALLAGSPAIDAGDSALSGPVTMYRFEEIAGTTVEDLVGTQDGSYHGGVELGQAASPIVGGQAVLFDGVDDRATVPASVANDFSFSLWVKTPQPALGGVRIGLIDADAVNAMPGFGLYVESGRIVFRAAGNPVTALTPINDNNWHHVAVTRHATTGARNVYVDGVLRGSATGGITGALTDVAEWQIGRLIAGVGHFVGALDELAVYDRVLSTEEIARHAAAGAPVFDQRGEPHLRVLDGDAAEDIAIDIGAYERAFGETYTFVVDTLADESDGDYSAGDFSLREAIELANANPGADEIEFDPALWAEGPATIVLTDGELVITDALTIQGLGKDLLTIDAQQQSRIFNISATEGDYEIAGLTLKGGRTTDDNLGRSDTTHSGGAIRSLTLGNLVLSDCSISDNSTEGGSAIGGGIFALGSLHVHRSEISRNSTANSDADGGGIVAHGDIVLSHSTVSGNSTRGTRASGGGIFAASSLMLLQSTVSGNSTAGTGAKGGGIFGLGSVAVTQSTVSGNSTTGVYARGGGVYALSFEGVTLSQSTIRENRTAGGFACGGGIWASSSVSAYDTIISGNITTGDSASGAGIYANLNVSLTRSTVSGNITTQDFAHGAGILARSNVTLLESAITDNRTAGNDASGGGIHALRGVALWQSTISGNSTGGNAAHGGGIFALGSVALTQSTVSGNSTTGSTSRGGGIHSNRLGIFVTQSTVTDNRAVGSNNSGGGLWSNSAQSQIAVTGSIVAGNLATVSNPDLGAASGEFSISNSFIGDSAGTTLDETPTGMQDVNGNLIGGPNNGVIDPRLGPLTDNGGPTKTHALLPGSPAIDAGDAAAVAGVNGVPEFDQRGIPWGRVLNGDDVPEARIDMGAVEWQANPLPGDYNFDGVVDAADYSVWRDTLGSTNDLRADGSSVTTPGAPDGVVDEHDYAWWKANFGNVLGQGSAATASGYVLQATEEESTAEQVSSGTRNAVFASRDVFDPQPPALPGVASVLGPYLMDTSADEVDAGLPPADPATGYPAGVGERADVAAVARDSGLLAWMAQRLGAAALDNKLDGSRVESPDGDEGAGSRDCAVLDELYALADLGW